MDAAAHLAAVRTEGDALVDAAKDNLDKPVPGCPGWTGADLLAHIGRVHRWAASAVRDRATGRPSFPSAPGTSELAGWYAEGLDELCAALDDDPTIPVWTWAGDGTIGWWQRRQAQETAVHRWDAQSAGGDPQPIDADLAVDGIDELLDVFAGIAAQVGRLTEPASIHVHTTDVDGEWLAQVRDGALDLRREHAKGDLAIRGPASDVLLVLWGRQPLSTVDAFGDAEVYDRWRAQLTG